jgi:gamma-glutamylaminecyclotransferase
MHLIFVFGTLKRGFPFHSRLAGASFLGHAVTLDPFPMFVAGAIFGPMMLDRPGRGLQVRGELYRVTEEGLAGVDEAENVGAPGNFRRSIEVRRSSGHRHSALAFFKHARLARPRRSGYLCSYHDRRFREPKARPLSLPPLRLLSPDAV